MLLLALALLIAGRPAAAQPLSKVGAYVAPDGNIFPPLPQAKAAADAIAWGASSPEGLQAGVGLLTTTTLRVGEAFSLEYEVRNVSRTPVHFYYSNIAVWQPKIEGHARSMTGQFTNRAEGKAGGAGDRVSFYETGRYDILTGPQRGYLEPGASGAVFHDAIVFAPSGTPAMFRGGSPWNWIAQARAGDYRLSAMVTYGHTQDEVLKSGFMPTTASLHMDTGWMNLRVQASDHAALSELVAARLREKPKAFNLKIMSAPTPDPKLPYSGPAPLPELWLSSLGASTQFNPAWHATRISHDDAQALIEHLRKNDYLWEVIDPPERPAERAAAGNAGNAQSMRLILMSGDQPGVMDWRNLPPIELGSGLVLRSNLERIAGGLTGEAKAAVEKLLQNLKDAGK